MNASPSEFDPRRQMNLEGNIARLVASAGHLPTGVADSLLEPVLGEVRRQRRSRVRRRAVAVALTSIAAAAAVLLVAVVIQRSPLPTKIRPVQPPPTQPEMASAATDVAKVKALSGLVSVADRGSPRALAGRQGVGAGQWLKTAWGSRAEVVLADQSLLVVQAHTRLQINSSRHGKEIRLDEGRIRLDVAKQPPHKTVTISTPDAQVTVVGTVLDVQVLTKADGRKQTWVDVHSGRVELVSGARRVVLLPNMQGVATAGEPPIARSQTAEVNELARLAGQATALAAKAGTPSGGAAIVEFSGDGTATVWSVFKVAKRAGAVLSEGLLECTAANSDLEVFSPQGARFPLVREAKGWRVDWSADPVPSGTQRTVVVRVGNVPGLFASLGRGAFEFSGRAAQPAALSLLQLRLPSSARLDEMTPEPLEVRRSLSRLVLTIPSAYRLPKLVRESAH